MTELDLLRRHVDVLFDTDRDGRLVGLNEPGRSPPPRLFLARGRRTHRLWFRADVPAATADACRQIAASLTAWDGEPTDRAFLEPLRAALADNDPGHAEWHGPAYRFGERFDLPVDGPIFNARLIDEASAHLLERYFPYTRWVLAARRPVVGVVLDGWVVSACYSARRRPSASEAGVATEEPYRGRGLAALVVAAWRDAVERDGAEPLYSTSWDNAASRSVARKLGLIAYGETFSLT